MLLQLCLYNENLTNKQAYSTTLITKKDYQYWIIYQNKMIDEYKETIYKNKYEVK